MKTLTNISMLGICVVVGLTLLTLRAGPNDIYKNSLITDDNIGSASIGADGVRFRDLKFSVPVGRSFEISIQRLSEGTWKLIGNSGHVTCKISDLLATKYGFPTSDVTCLAEEVGNDAWVLLQNKSGTTIKIGFKIIKKK